MSIFNYAYEFLEVPVTSARKGLKTLTHFRGRKYREFEFGPDRNQRVILFEPKTVRHDAVVLYFHGGYLSGSPDDLSVAADVFCEKGYRFISVGYRLLTAAPFPAQVEDAFHGYAVAMKVLEMTGVCDPPIIVAGNSAGAQLAGLLAYSTELSEEYGVDTRAIAGVLSIAGVMSVRDLPSAVRLLIGRSLPKAGRKHALDKYSPIEALDIDSTAQFLAVHGKQDRIAPYAGELHFVRKLNTIDTARREMIRRSEEEAGFPEMEEGIMRSKAEGGGNTPIARYAGWDETVLGEEEKIAQIFGLKKWKYQHIRLTAGLYAGDKKDDRVLRVIFRWLSRFDGIAMVVDPDPRYPARAVLTRDTFHKSPTDEPFYEEDDLLDELSDYDPEEDGAYRDEEAYPEEADYADAGSESYAGDGEGPEDTGYPEADDAEDDPDAPAFEKYYNAAYGEENEDLPPEAETVYAAETIAVDMRQDFADAAEAEMTGETMAAFDETTRVDL